MRKRLAIVVPTHKNELNVVEISRLRISLSNIRPFDVIFVIPESLEPNNLLKLFPNAQIVKFQDKNFVSVESYNHLLMKKEFYLRFKKYRMILIMQTDSILVNQFQYRKIRKYDYVGSPWPRQILAKLEKGIFTWSVSESIIDENKTVVEDYDSTQINVGNGGLSLRNVNSMIKICECLENTFVKEKLQAPEDVVISFLAKKIGLKVPSYKEAEKFFQEESAEFHLGKIKCFGYHNFDTHYPILNSMLRDE